MQTAQKTTDTSSPLDDIALDESRDNLVSSLLVASAQGDREAFSRLYQHTSSHLFAIALRIVRCRELAEEVLQDAYVSIWRRADSQRHGVDSAYAWMVTVVRHRAIDAVRREKQSREIAIDDYALVERPEDSSAPVADTSIASYLVGLPETHRCALLYVFHYGFTHQELSETLGVPLGTAKSWVRRGLTQLKARVQK